MRSEGSVNDRAFFLRFAPQHSAGVAISPLAPASGVSGFKARRRQVQRLRGNGGASPRVNGLQRAVHSLARLAAEQLPRPALNWLRRAERLQRRLSVRLSRCNGLRGVLLRLASLAATSTLGGGRGVA